MRERIKDKDRLQHILDAIDVLQSGAQRYSLEQIEKDSILYFGFVKQVEIIGEAVYMLTKEFRESHPDIEWDAIEGMRHVLVHGYYEISPDKVWNVIEKDLPILRPKIQDLLGK
ncbi:MAG: DUF86 domain-containing protein [Bacteroidales bacterium]|nr:DUF86 domain-containing protein [Bacteroidales bacterium]